MHLLCWKPVVRAYLRQAMFDLAPSSGAALRSAKAEWPWQEFIRRWEPTAEFSILPRPGRRASSSAAFGWYERDARRFLYSFHPASILANRL